MRFTARLNPQTPHISTVIWEFPDEQAQRTIEKLIEEHISKLTKTLSPKTITFSGEPKDGIKIIKARSDCASQTQINFSAIACADLTFISIYDAEEHHR